MKAAASDAKGQPRAMANDPRDDGCDDRDDALPETVRVTAATLQRIAMREEAHNSSRIPASRQQITQNMYFVVFWCDRRDLTATWGPRGAICI